jgi:CheY-like chemotaxis protein
MSYITLIVEDEPDGQEVLAGILAHFGYATQTVDSAEAALRLLESRQYAAVIIDIALPGMDGLALLKTIRQNPQTASLPCMVVTAYHSSLVRKEAFEAGCNSYLTKPIKDGVFMEELNNMLSGL